MAEGSPNLPCGYSLTADLPGETYEFPEHITPSIALRPDIVVWHGHSKSVWLFELTACFKSQAADRKAERYM